MNHRAIGCGRCVRSLYSVQKGLQMDKHWNMEYLGVMVDMAGCPNRCRHCWLGGHKNGSMSVADFRAVAARFKAWRDEQGNGIGELGFFSWWREPDFRDDYRELWALEQALSSPGRAQRFELLSVWRLARDEHYAPWAATLAPKVCQITFFGMEAGTDWGMRRTGAFRDNLLATQRLLAAGIAPRWQLFLTKRCLGELDAFMRLMEDLKLDARCRALGQPFDFFIGGISPEGKGYELEDERLEQDDLACIPADMAALSRGGLSMLGQPECQLYGELAETHAPPNRDVSPKVLSVNADFDVYPNLAEPAPWWRLGNLKRDGADAVIRAFRDETPPGMRANRTVPLSQLARRYGNPHSSKLYDRDDLICRYVHRWGLEYMEANRSGRPKNPGPTHNNLLR